MPIVFRIDFDKIVCIFGAAAVKPHAIMYLEQVFVKIIFLFSRRCTVGERL